MGKSRIWAEGSTFDTRSLHVAKAGNGKILLDFLVSQDSQHTPRRIEMKGPEDIWNEDETGLTG
jgi:hypothetical protein